MVIFVRRYPLIQHKQKRFKSSLEKILSCLKYCVKQLHTKEIKAEMNKHTKNEIENKQNKNEISFPFLFFFQPGIIFDNLLEPAFKCDDIIGEVKYMN